MSWKYIGFFESIKGPINLNALADTLWALTSSLDPIYNFPQKCGRSISSISKVIISYSCEQCVRKRNHSLLARCLANILTFDPTQECLRRTFVCRRYQSVGPVFIHKITSRKILLFNFFQYIFTSFYITVFIVRRCKIIAEKNIQQTDNFAHVLQICTP
jgi:hypothetical protein